MSDMKEKIEAKLKEYRDALIKAGDQVRALNVAIAVCEQLLEDKETKETDKKEE